MWEIKGKPVDPKRFTPFEPLRILSYYDGPRIFTFDDADDALCLACWSDEDEKCSRFLVVAVTDQIIADLESGLLSVRKALAQPRLWVTDSGARRRPHRRLAGRPQGRPRGCQPQPRTMLHRSLDPILSLRATGEGIRPGNLPGSVIESTSKEHSERSSVSPR